MTRKNILTADMFYPIFLVALFLFAVPAFAQQKEIKLRKQTLVTPAPERGGLTSQTARESETPASGLHLVQFAGPPREEWKDQLRGLGVEIIRYIPDDAYLVRLNNAPTGQLRRQPFVHWVGKFEDVYKTHERIERGLNNEIELADDVRILIDPNSDANELDAARRSLRVLKQEARSRFGTVLAGEVTRQQLEALVASENVLWIEPASDPVLYDEIATKIVAGDDGLTGTFAEVHELGYQGDGVTVAVADSGLDQGTLASVHPDLLGRVEAFFHYGSLSSAADGHGHGTHVTGIIAGNAATGQTDESGSLYGLGVAPRSRIVAQRIFDDVGGYTLNDDFQTLTRDAVQSGAIIGSNSWGDDTQGEYDLPAAIFDALVRDADDQTPGDQPYILEFSAGNAGPGRQTIGSPAVAKNVIATGASQNDRSEFFQYVGGPDAMADFSSRGPTEDGRIKPDLVAPGTWIASLQSSGATSANAWLPINENYQYQGGTSQAGPMVSGAAAVFVEYYREEIENTIPSPALVKAALINSAVDMDNSSGTSHTPNMAEGWGRVDLTNLIGSERTTQFLDQTELLETGEVHEERIIVGDPLEPLKITLTYTDVPGIPAAIPSLVNDLDLVVIDPNGNSFHGNQFENGFSVPDAPTLDRINNVEGVLIMNPVVGEYIIRTIAYSVAEDARIDTPETDQDFALVISGILPAPGVGLIAFNKRSFTAPDTIDIRVIDFDLIGLTEISVTISSDTETVAETVSLTSPTGNGIFAGQISTAADAPQNDGVLQISHSDLIEAEYSDASPAAIRTATADADFVPPLIISSVTTGSEFGKALIEWASDEPARYVIRYGQNGTLDQTISSDVLTANHEAVIADLFEGQAYQFTIELIDEAGNARLFDNNGSNYQFIGPATPTVLVVDAFYEDFFNFPGLLVIEAPPITNYTDALDASGTTYDVWSVQTQGPPTLEDLTPFKVVFWRFPEPAITLPDFTIEEQEALRDYLDGGGSVMIASMDLLSRFGADTSFSRDVLHVDGFVEDIGVPSVTGIPEDTTTSGIDATLDYSSDYGVDDDIFEGYYFDFSDTLSPGEDALPVLRSEDSEGVVGLKYPRQIEPDTGRLLFFSFPLDAIPMNGTSPNNRVEFVRRAVDFLAPGDDGDGEIFLDRRLFTVSNPSLVKVFVADSDLVGETTVSVTAINDDTGQSFAFDLLTTTRKGEFAGTFSAVSLNEPFSASEKKLPVADDGSFRVVYFDQSQGAEISAIGRIDIVPPVVSNVAVEPDYNSVTIRWTTSEPADSLVQYGESRFLGLTGYSPDLRTQHRIVISSFLVDEINYFSVTSRDQAGNAATLDNGGTLYSFTTLKSIVPPWGDDLEGNIDGWLAIPRQEFISANELVYADGEIVEWMHGTPQFGFDGANGKVWASNLDHEFNGGADTLLISPSIDLRYAGQATLQFRHAYDFTGTDLPVYDIVGEVYVTENDGADLEFVKSFTGAENAWTTTEIDLTPYVGKKIRLAFYYGFIEIYNSSRKIYPGWMLDDFSITMETLDQGTLEVASNLSQASFQIMGTSMTSGSGRFSEFDAMPFGEYTVTFNPVQYYQTPSPQTGTLSLGAPLSLEGNYTFDDTNQNGISDAWELVNLGSVSPTHTQTTDSDHDGFSDYEEFIAGTDPNNFDPDSPDNILQLDTPVAMAENRLEISWNTVAGRTYRIETSTDTVNWGPVSEWLPGDGSMISVDHEITDANLPHLFRVQARP